MTAPGDHRVDVEVPAALAGVRLDRAVSMLADVTRAEAAELVDGGQVSVGGKAVTNRSRKLRQGDHVTVDASAVAVRRAEPVTIVAKASVEFSVVYEDEDLVVVDKPAGLVVHPGAGGRTETLAAGLLARYPELTALPESGAGAPDRPGIVHRLDKDTSGLLVVARTAEAHVALTAQLARRTMGRVYRALVLGHLDRPKGIVDAPIGRSVEDRTSMAVVGSGRGARTSYEVLRRFSEPMPLTSLELSLETGRTHQIRVHMAAIGHPVLGDRRYGGRRGTLDVGRPMLHAYQLHLDHPRTGEAMQFEAPIPVDMTAVLRALK